MDFLLKLKALNKNPNRQKNLILTAASLPSSLSPHLLLLLLLQVGFFPCNCVELINDKIPDSVQNSVPKPGTSSG